MKDSKIIILVSIIFFFIGTILTSWIFRGYLDEYRKKLAETSSELESIKEEYNEQLYELNDYIELLEWDNAQLNEALIIRTEDNIEMSYLVRKALETLDAAYSESIDEHEFNLLLRAVESESGNQRIETRIAVTNVILNQVHSSLYPDNITQVIYERAPSGAFHFSVVYDNRINEVIVSDETREAVLRALAGERHVDWNVLAFATEEIDFSDWCVKDELMENVQFWVPKIAQ